jgi:hypothetical protein
VVIFYSTISDINIYGGYHEYNNKLTTDGLVSLPSDAIFSFSTVLIVVHQTAELVV